MSIIRNEIPADYREVEELTKKAFWNVNSPGCNEHYLVHVMRNHSDFVPELDFVLEEDGHIIGNIMYTKSRLLDKEGDEKEILTFGPFSVLPGYQRKGYGKRLLEASFQRAAELGYEAIVIFGNPENYICRGFKSCKKYNIGTDWGVFPVPLLVRELKEGALDGRPWIYRESPAYEIDESKFEEFDGAFEQLEKGYQESQELFYIYSHSVVRAD